MATMNKIVVYFTECSPAPSGGYKVYWRVQGSSDPYTLGGTFFISPAVFYDTVNPAGTCYEGIIQTDCGNEVVGSAIPWASCESESGGGDTVHIVNISASVTIEDVNGIAGFTLGGPVAPGQVDSGTHTGFTGAIGVTVSGTPISGSLSLFRNGLLLECMNVGFAGSYAFSSFTFAADDEIQVRWFGGSC